MRKHAGRVLVFACACFCLSALAWCNVAEPYDFNKAFKPFISQDKLDEVGAFLIDGSNICCTKSRDHYFFLFAQEKLILKVDNLGKILIKLQAQEGQGPGEMLAPKSVSMRGSDVVVFDAIKNKLLFFGDNLEYLKETQAPMNASWMCSTSDGGWLAWMDRENDSNTFSLFEDNLVKSKDFGHFQEKVPFSGVYPFALRRGFLSLHSAIASCWIFFNSECRAVYYNLDKIDDPIEFKWKNPFVLSQSDVRKRTNVYEAQWMTKKGDDIFVFAHRYKNKDSQHYYEMITFSDKGVLKKRIDVPFSVIKIFTTDANFPILAAHDDSIWMEK